MIYEKAKIILSLGFVCDRCMGRQFRKIKPNISNEEKGKIIKNFFRLEAEVNGDMKKHIIGKECWVCSNIFQEVERLTKKAIRKLRKIEFNSFSVGIRMMDDLILKEESLWDKVGNEYAEPIKSEIRRMVETRIRDALGKILRKTNHDISVIIDLQTNEVDLYTTPVYVAGYYKKFTRGLAQLRSKKYRTSVQSIIAKPIKKVFAAKDDVFHTTGREEKEARCLVWRPFILEVIEPKRRKVNTKKIQAEINRDPRIRVKNLRLATKSEIVELKSKRYWKTYRVLVDFENPVESIGDVRSVVGMITQRTPSRLETIERIRHKKVKSIKWKMVNNKRYRFDITCESGLYVRELVEGDRGRTKPSIASVLNNKARVVEYDLIGLEEIDKNGKADKRVQKRNKKKAVSPAEA